MSENTAPAAPRQPPRVPRWLRRQKNWLCWDLVDNGRSKPDKTPFYADGTIRFGTQGSKADRARLVLFGEAWEAAVRLGMGVGFAPLKGTGICALDFDDCVLPNGSLPPEIAELASLTYAEYSPSGRGVRVLALGDFGNGKDHRRIPYGFEAFSTKGFVTMTGNVLDITRACGTEDTIADVTPQIEAIFAARKLTRQSVAPYDPNDPNSNPFTGHAPTLDGWNEDRCIELVERLNPDISRIEWIKVGMGLHHQFSGGEEGFWVWDSWSMGGDKYPGEDALRQQWVSFDRHGDEPHAQITLRSVIDMANKADSKIDLSALRESSKAALAMADTSTATTPPGYIGPYRIESIAAAIATSPPDYWIKGVLPKATLGMIYGASTSGKTFVAIDMAMSVALGREWHGRRVKRGRVLYIAAEGGISIARRFAAYCKKYGLDPAEATLVGLMRSAPNLRDAESVAELIKAIAAAGSFDLIIIDTLAQTTPGANENSSEDMSVAIENCQLVAKEAEAMVVLVHHAGKDASKGARGWSGLKAAVDAEIEVARQDTGQREVTLTKIKDGEEGLHWSLVLERWVLGIDDDGDDITSCVAMLTETARARVEDPKRGVGVKRRDQYQRHVLEVVADQYSGINGAKLEDLVGACTEAFPAPEKGRDVRRELMTDAIKALAKEKPYPLLSITDGSWVTFRELGG